MAICPVCGDQIGFFAVNVGKGVSVHTKCERQYLTNRGDYEPEKLDTKKDKSINDGETSSLNDSSSFKVRTNKVQVTSIDMPFGNMVFFMVKWAIASIPALIILFIIVGIIYLIFGALFF